MFPLAEIKVLAPYPIFEPYLGCDPPPGPPGCPVKRPAREIPHDNDSV